MKRVALISGVTGMDGSHMADLLLSKDYIVHGLVRRHSYSEPWRIRHILNRIKLHTGDLTDGSSLASILTTVQPDEVYNFAAQSFVKASFDIPAYTAESTGIGALNLFEAVRSTCRSDTRIYQASSSEMFGNVQSPQDEESPMNPASPYGVAKLFAHKIASVYRASYGMFISCGISFNHESERRGPEFVTRKITMAVAQIKAGIQDKLELGNLDAKRDWSYAPDIMQGAWLSLQHDTPDDYVFASGESHTVSELADIAFKTLGLNPADHIVSQVAEHQRPTDVWNLCGNPHKARNVLGWRPTLTFKELVQRMVAYDLSNAVLIHNRTSSNAN